MASRARLATSALALGLGVVLALAAWRNARSGAEIRSAERAQAAETAGRDLAAELARAASVAGTRARSLAEIIAVQSAITTDAATVTDMVRRDQTLKVAPDEGVWIAKLAAAGVERLYAQPES